MIDLALLFGVPILLVVWLAGLPAVWRGQPKLAFWAGGLIIAAGLVAALVAGLGPRRGNFWNGHGGIGGDGMGMLGVTIGGLIVAGFGMLLFITAAVIASIRSADPIQEETE